MDYSSGKRSVCIGWITVLILTHLHRTSVLHARQCYVCGIGPADPMYSTLLAQHGAISISSTTDINGGGGRSIVGSHTNLLHGNNATTKGDDDDDIVVDNIPAQLQPSGACAHFEHADADPNAYLAECPVGYMGCITQSDGTTTMRTCNRHSIDDCKTANRVTYCYCNTDRCNGRDRPAQPSIITAATAATATAVETALKTSTKRQQPFFSDQSYRDDDEDGEDDDDSAAGIDDEDADIGPGSGDGQPRPEDEGHDTRGLIESVWSTERTAVTAQIMPSNATTEETPTTEPLPPNNHNHRAHAAGGNSGGAPISGAGRRAGFGVIAIIPVCLAVFVGLRA